MYFYTYIYIHIYAYTHTHIHIHIHIRMRICMRICICICIYIYIHTYIHGHPPPRHPETRVEDTFSWPGERTMCGWGCGKPGQGGEEEQTRRENNSYYNASAFSYLCKKTPRSRVLVPCSRYYNLSGALPVRTPEAMSIKYTPMDSEQAGWQRQCSSNDVCALANFDALYGPDSQEPYYSTDQL